MIDDAQMRRYFNEIFLGSAKGRAVFNYMLKDMGFYAETEGDPRKEAINDYAKRLLFYTGVFDPTNFQESDKPEFVVAISKMPFPLTEKKSAG